MWWRDTLPPPGTVTLNKGSGTNGVPVVRTREAASTVAGLIVLVVDRKVPEQPGLGGRRSIPNWENQGRTLRKSKLESGREEESVPPGGSHPCKDPGAAEKCVHVG